MSTTLRLDADILSAAKRSWGRHQAAIADLARDAGSDYMRLGLTDRQIVERALTELTERLDRATEHLRAGRKDLNG